MPPIVFGGLKSGASRGPTPSRLVKPAARYRVVGARVDQRRALLELRADVEELAQLVGLADGDEEPAGDAGALHPGRRFAQASA